VPAETISSLVDRCEAGRRSAEAWSEHLARVALEVGPGPHQRLAVAGSHRMDRIAGLWAARRPTIPSEPTPTAPETVGPAGSLDGLETMLTGLIADADTLLTSSDPDLDPSTCDLARRIRSEAGDLLALHDRLAR
jgi:hypothetical protein